MGEQIFSQVLQLLEQKTQTMSSSRTPLIPWIGFMYSFGGDSGFDSRYLSLAWTESLGETLFACGKAWCYSYLADSHTSPVRVVRVVTSTGARGPGDMIEHLLSHVGGNHHPTGVPGVPDLCSTGHQTVCAQPTAPQESGFQLQSLQQQPLKGTAYSSMPFKGTLPQS